MAAGEQGGLSPIAPRQVSRIHAAIRGAEAFTGLRFGVFIGELAEPTRQDAERLHARLAQPSGSVLIAISPNQRVLEIVTGELAALRLSDRTCHLTALSMTSAFGGGDLAGGIVAGVAQLAGSAGPRGAG